MAVSHEGGTWATNEALREAGEAGCATALITVSDRSPGAGLAQDLIQTREQDQSWCHTVGYLSPMLAATALAAALREHADRPHRRARAARQLPTHARRRRSGCRRAGARADRLLVIGTGADYAAARELALKVEGGRHLPVVGAPARDRSAMATWPRPTSAPAWC